MPESPTKLEWADCDQKPTGGIMNDPRREDVEAILDHLGRCATGFVILAVSEQKYIQTIFRTKERPQDGFDVEYQAGSTKRHYELDAEHLDLSTVKRLFLA